MGFRPNPAKNPVKEKISVQFSNFKPQLPPEGSAVALGNFDGVHLGHQKIIAVCVSLAKKEGLASVVWSFAEHPGKFLGGGKSFGSILNLQEKTRLFMEMGVDLFMAENFAAVRDLSPREFCRKILVETCRARVVVCGFDFRFGKGAQGTGETLKEILEPQGVRVVVVEPVLQNGEKVSSTAIRAFLEAGDMESAARLLGRPYFVSLPVEHGKELGRKLGFPTINQNFPADFAPLKKGVYAVRVNFDGKEYRGVCNIGSRPSVDDGEKVNIETHILDFSGDLYGKTIRVNFDSFLRNEKKFATLEELKNQVRLDKEHAKQYFERKK